MADGQTSSSDQDKAPGCTRYRIEVSYDGTHYSGWQWQANGISIQQKIEEAIEKIFRVSLRIHGSSRTDTGVHAIGLVAHFDLQNSRDGSPPVTEEKLPLALNSQLPRDISITAASIVDSNFHARFSAIAKQYRYFIWNSRQPNPHLRTSAWHYPISLDVGLMRQAAKLIPGRRDFRCFAKHHTYEIEDTVRTVFRCSVRKSGDSLICIILEGDGFLYRMCRGIAGTLAQVGMGKYQPEAIIRMLESESRSQAGMTAPSHGLFLWKVFYENDSNTPVLPANNKSH